MIDAEAPGGAIQHARVPSERSLLWRVKLRLQFSGWLQYLPNAVAALSFLALAALGRWIGVWPVPLVRIPMGLAAVLLANLAFDLVTVKLGIHPPEAVPGPNEALDPFELMRARRSCRSFQPRDLLDGHRAAILASVRRFTAAPVLLGERPIRFEYIAAPLTVWPTVGAHEFLVAIGPRAYDRTAIIDVGRSLQRVVLDATRMGVATCWIGPGADHTSIIRHLGERFDPDTDHIVCVCAVGYASRYVPLTVRLLTHSMHNRLPLSALFYADAGFRHPLDTTTPPFGAFGRCYEACQWSPSSYNGQTTRGVGVASVADGEVRRARMDFYAATTSRFYAPVALGIWCANWEVGCQALGIDGHFAELPLSERGVAEPSGVARYDVSWIAEDPGALGAAEPRA
jgi:nitroreductase